jgi:membrane-associated protease RseP (regulator of RpoE activity)
VLAGIVSFHELGHFLAARVQNITVDEFAVGVGPKLLGVERGGIEYNLRALPLGGFVRFPEHYNQTLQMDNEELARDIRREIFLEQEAEKAQNMGVPATLLGKLAATLTPPPPPPTPPPASKLPKALSFLEPLLGSTRKKKAKRRAIPDLEIDYYDNPNLLQNRPPLQRSLVLSMGIVFNVILSFSLYAATLTVGPGLPSPVLGEGVAVLSQPAPGTPAGDARLMRGDVITAVDGRGLGVPGSVQGAGEEVDDGERSERAGERSERAREASERSGRASERSEV